MNEARDGLEAAAELHHRPEHEDSLLRSECPAEENRILRSKLGPRVHLTDPKARPTRHDREKARVEGARGSLRDREAGYDPGLAPEARGDEFDGSKKRGPGRPRIDAAIERQFFRVAQENRSWGYDRIVGSLANVGMKLSRQTVANILKRHDLKPAPERKDGTTRAESIRSLMDVLVGTDFFTLASPV